MRKILAVLVLLLPLAACGASSSNADNEVTVTTQAGPGVTLHCGYERWSIKTGTDPLASKVNLQPQPATIAKLGSIPSPLPKVTSKYPPQTPREPSEEQAYAVTATVVRYAAQQDGDIHIVLQDGTNTMIAEIPNPQCVKGGPFLSGITAARAAFLAKTGYKPPIIPKGQYTPHWVKASIPATLTGVGFFDFPHGQSGVAPNAIELHPVLSFKAT